MADDLEAVLDASAVIALLWEERGAEVVEPLLGRAAMSTVNWTEVLQRYRAQGIDIAGKRDSVEALGIAIEAFSAEEAETAGELWEPTRKLGLGLADRACMAFARQRNVAAYTADRDWQKVDVGVDVVLIR